MKGAAMANARTLTRKDPKAEGKTSTLQSRGLERCEVCGNAYDKCFTISRAGKTYVFDCLECAIHVIAPSCERCGIRIIGHGVEANGSFFCCAHCAGQQGVTGVRDRA